MAALSTPTSSSPTRRVKTAVKSRLKALRVGYARRFQAFTAEDLKATLARLGVVPGDALLVHSAYDAFNGFAGKPTDVIGVLADAVTHKGLLIMPTLPFTGTAVDHVEKNPLFDVARTPSRMGLLSELFRRSDGVVRSVHPTHAVAVLGDHATTFVMGHHASRTPCGAGSPYMKLRERDGKVLLAGVGIDSLTVYHAVEEALEARLTPSPFTSRSFVLQSKLADGSIVETTTRLFEPAVSRRRNLGKLVPELERLGAWREARVGTLKLTMLRVVDVFDAAVALADRGIYCYD